MAYAINTQKTVDKLKNGDVFNHAQAGRIVDTIVDATAHLATKKDLKNLEDKFDNKFDHLEQRVDLKLDSYKSDIINKMWTMQMATAGLIIGAVALLLNL